MTIEIRTMLSWIMTLAAVAKPNVLFIVADDQGYANIGYHNSTTQTPKIDALAREGVILEA